MGHVPADLQVEILRQLLFDENRVPAAVVALRWLRPGAAVQIGVTTDPEHVPGVLALVIDRRDAAEGGGGELALVAVVDQWIRQVQSDDIAGHVGALLVDDAKRIEIGLLVDEAVGRRDARGRPDRIAGGVHVGPRGGPGLSAGDEVDGRPAAGDPLEGVAVEAPDEARGIDPEVVVLVVERDGRVGEGLGGDSKREAILVLTFVLAEFALLVVQGVEAKGEFVLHERLVVVERNAARVPPVRLELHLGFPPVQQGAFCARDGGALGTADADQQRVGPERQRGALRVVIIRHIQRGEEVVRDRLVAGVGDEAADRKRLAGAVAHLGAALAVGVGVVALDRVDARGVEQGAVERVDGEVTHELRREDRQRRADVAQIRAQPGTREGFGGRVTAVGFGRDYERRKYYGVGGGWHASGGGRSRGGSLRTCGNGAERQAEGGEVRWQEGVLHAGAVTGLGEGPTGDRFAGGRHLVSKFGSRRRDGL